jgi:cytochrome oxidase Cu insertion factor (SCO1/SenC/PrrC family)
MAVIVFLVLIVLVAVIWGIFAVARAGAKAADTGIDRTNSEGGPTLLEDDLSFTNRDDAPDTGPREPPEPVDSSASRADEASRSR